MSFKREYGRSINLVAALFMCEYAAFKWLLRWLIVYVFMHAQNATFGQISSF